MAETISRVEQLKKDLAKELKQLAGMLDGNQKLQAAAKLEISFVSFTRYTKGDVNELRNLELAEQMISVLKKFKQPS